MCEDVKRNVNKIKTKPGAMTEGAKQGFELMLNEISKVHTEVNDIKHTVVAQNHRLEVMEKATAQTLEMVNKNDKLEANNIEQKAAVVDAFQRFAGSKIGKAIIILFLLCGGLSIAYVVEHATNVSQIVESVK